MANAAASLRLVEAGDLGPVGESATDQRSFAASLGAEAAALGGVNNGRGAPATDRLRVYRNNVIVSLLEARRAAWTPPEPRFTRGYGWIYSRHIQQADKGCDFDYLETAFGGATAEPAIW